jgi:hypothetical protein
LIVSKQVIGEAITGIKRGNHIPDKVETHPNLLLYEFIWIFIEQNE